MNGKLAGVFDITDFGAVPDGRTPCTQSVARAFAECAKRRGGTVYIPAGNFLTGPLTFCSDTSLYLESGSLLRFSDDPADYPVISDQWEGADCEVYSPLIYGRGLKNVVIEGHGTIDGQGAAWWRLQRENALRCPRPRAVVFTGCENVKISGIRIINSPSWTLNPIECSSVVIDGVTIRNPADSPNTDGIDPCSCSGVNITNCLIDVGDDCIAVKSGREECPRRIPCENVIVSHCRMLHGHGGIVLGSEMSGGVRGVVIGDCIFEDTDRGLRIKSCRGRGGAVEDVMVSNILMRGTVCPFAVNLYYFCGVNGHAKKIWDKSPRPVDDGTPAVRRVSVSGVTALGTKASAGLIYGLPEMPADDLRFENVSVEMAADARPGFADMLDGLDAAAKKGFFIGNASRVVLSGVRVSGCDGPAFTADNVAGLTLSGCGGEVARGLPDYLHIPE